MQRLVLVLGLGHGRHPGLAAVSSPRRSSGGSTSPAGRARRRRSTAGRRPAGPAARAGRGGAARRAPRPAPPRPAARRAAYVVSRRRWTGPAISSAGSAASSSLSRSRATCGSRASPSTPPSHRSSSRTGPVGSGSRSGAEGRQRRRAADGRRSGRGARPPGCPRRGSGAPGGAARPPAATAAGGRPRRRRRRATAGWVRRRSRSPCSAAAGPGVAARDRRLRVVRRPGVDERRALEVADAAVGTPVDVAGSRRGGSRDTPTSRPSTQLEAVGLALGRARAPAGRGRRCASAAPSAVLPQNHSPGRPSTSGGTVTRRHPRLGDVVDEVAVDQVDDQPLGVDARWWRW